MATIKYTVDSKHRVNFDCPVCQYERGRPMMKKNSPATGHDPLRGDRNT